MPEQKELTTEKKEAILLIELAGREELMSKAQRLTALLKEVQELVDDMNSMTLTLNITRPESR